MHGLFVAMFVIGFYQHSVAQTQSHQMKCDLELVTCKTQKVLGKNIGYVVEIKNGSSKEIDGVEWTAFFYTRFGKLKGKRQGDWTSGNFISPKDTDETFIEVESNFIDGADDVFITIKKVHYTDGSSCK